MSDFATNMARVRREQIRWFLLLALNVARPAGAYSEVLLSVVQATYADATRLEIHRELDYLEERELVHIHRDPTDRWSCELTRHGVDIVEYTVDVEPGIARPKHPGG
ncbi:MAG: hypothetical protein KIT35_21995 [Piscinibacter sp.]|uniref:hypothetical protein n=1 Tax=Piscinibacter sp. TaxID=1903157 RepID=UPI0025837FB3|nr:hypothetical protein [Piscinibacter sp.]MCW5666513.1 hypothetical protein [Piscinibacter sp.]